MFKSVLRDVKYGISFFSVCVCICGGFETSKVIFILFLTGPGMFFINRKNIKFSSKKVSCHVDSKCKVKEIFYDNFNNFLEDENCVVRGFVRRFDNVY